MLSTIADYILRGLAGMLAFFYGLVPSYGFAITLFTIAVMAALAPLTLKQTRSMLAMQRLQPEIKKLQQLHKGDRQAMSEAQMALFKEHGVNPLSGCFPILVQAPIFSFLYWVMQGLTHKVTGAKAAAACRETVRVCVDPKYLDKTTRLYQDLQESGGQMFTLGVDLAQKATAPHSSFFVAFPYYALVVLAMIASYVQMKRIYARNPQALAANPQAAMMNRLFPIMTGVFSLNMPAGVALYFFVSNLFRIGQQEAMYRWDPHVSSYAQAFAKEAEQKVEEAKHDKSKPKADEVKPRFGLFGARPGTAAGGSGAKTPPGKGKPEGPASPNGRAQPRGSRNKRRKNRKGR